MVNDSIIKDVEAVILAAGNSTRFSGKQSKLLTKVCGQAMVVYPVKAAAKLDIPIHLIVGKQKDSIKKELEKYEFKNISYFEQKEQLGTGHASGCSKEKWSKKNILIINGDILLFNEKIILELIQEHSKNDADLTFIAAKTNSPDGCARVIDEENGVRICEEKNCSEKQKKMNLVNAGVYLAKVKHMKALKELKKDTNVGEFLLTDLIEIFSNKGLKVCTKSVEIEKVCTVNTNEQLHNAEQIIQAEIIKKWINVGVRFENPTNSIVNVDVEIGDKTQIEFGVCLRGKTKIGRDCTINSNSILQDSIICDEVEIDCFSFIQESRIGLGAKVGPFARIRNNSIICDNSEIGNFVEIKNSKIENNSKVKHLSYIGDTYVGKKVNIGAGTITCNYDGIAKHKTIIEDNVFIGSNNTLVSPVIIGEGSYTAAGSTITHDVPQDSLAIARGKQSNKKNYAQRIKRKLTKSNTKTTPAAEISSI
jgi:bifunctional UDP-N-acetylglucosamine pyrophosphorylase / glucosamine-1-phosphate N-acetyltransferase